MSDSDPKIILSPLRQIIEADGHRFEVEIYRTEESKWVLELVDESNASIVWDEQFESDGAALDELKRSLLEDGAKSILQAPPAGRH